MLLREFFIQLSENDLLNSTAKKYGPKIRCTECSSWYKY